MESVIVDFRICYKRFGNINNDNTDALASIDATRLAIFAGNYSRDVIIAFSNYA